MSDGEVPVATREIQRSDNQEEGCPSVDAGREADDARGHGGTRIAGGSVAAAAGVICLSYGVYGWAAFFLALGALNLAGGYWYLTIDGSAPAGT